MIHTSHTGKYFILGLCVISTVLIIYLLKIKNAEEYIEENTPKPTELIVLMRPNAQEVPLGRSARGGK